MKFLNPFLQNNLSEKNKSFKKVIRLIFWINVKKK